MDDDVTDITGDPGAPDACYIDEDSWNAAVIVNDGGVKTWFRTGYTGHRVGARQILMRQAGRAVHRHNFSNGQSDGRDQDRRRPGFHARGEFGRARLWVG